MYDNNLAKFSHCFSANLGCQSRHFFSGQASALLTHNKTSFAKVKAKAEVKVFVVTAETELLEL